VSPYSTSTSTVAGNGLTAGGVGSATAGGALREQAAVSSTNRRSRAVICTLRMRFLTCSHYDIKPPQRGARCGGFA
jgi:hypothetical protein